MLQWIAFLAVVCALSVALNRRFERVLAPALCGLMGLLYVLAIPRVLSWVDWIAPVLLALTVASAIAALALRKLTPRALVARFAKTCLRQAHCALPAYAPCLFTPANPWLYGGRMTRAIGRWRSSRCGITEGWWARISIWPCIMVHTYPECS